jgi:hypothetical protein
MNNPHAIKSKRLLTKPGGEEDALEKEIEELIDREKAKGRIVSKLFNQTNPPTVK